MGLKDLHDAYDKHTLVPIASVFDTDGRNTCVVGLCSCGGLWGHAQAQSVIYARKGSDAYYQKAETKCNWRYLTEPWQASILNLMRHNSQARACWLGLPYRTPDGEDMAAMKRLELKLGLSKDICKIK
jgi:hypothetical protein